MLECFMVRASESSSDLGIGCGALVVFFVIAFVVVVAFVVVSTVVVVGAGFVSWLPDLRMDCDVMEQEMIGCTLAGQLMNLRLMQYLCKYWAEPASSMFEGVAAKKLQWFGEQAY